MSYKGFDLEKGLKRAKFFVKKKIILKENYFRIDFFRCYDGF